MISTYTWRQRFAVHGVVWRQLADWAVAQLPFYLLPLHMWFMTTFFVFFAAPARRAILRNLRMIFPKAGPVENYLRAWRTLYQFAWTIAEASHFKQNERDFTYELDGVEHLESLGATSGAIVLTAHMGAYDLGAAIFARKFGRSLRIVRAQESDIQSASHLQASLAQAGAGGVKVAYSNQNEFVSFDLLNALRAGEIISIQGDRTLPGAATIHSQLFGHPALFPAGPFALALTAEKPLFPLFVLRTGYRRYRIIVRPPLIIRRDRSQRDAALAEAVGEWASSLEEVGREHWDQWFALAPIFKPDGNDQV